MSKTIDTARLREKIKEYDAIIEQTKAERIEVGLPADIPKDFVDPIHAEVLKQRLEPFQEFITEYLALTNKAKRLIPIDLSEYESYVRDVKLLSWSTLFEQKTYGLMLLRCIDTITEAQGGNIAYERVVSQLLNALKTAEGFRSREYMKLGEVSDCKYQYKIDTYTGDDFDDILAGYWKHYTEIILPRKEKEYELLGSTFAG